MERKILRKRFGPVKDKGTTGERRIRRNNEEVQGLTSNRKYYDKKFKRENGRANIF